jgi:hypothetical protein
MKHLPTRTTGRAAQRLRWASAVALLGLAGGLLGPAPTGGATSTGTTTAPVVVDAGAVLRPVNRNLVGIHGRAPAASIATDYGDLAPTSHRHVMSDYDLIDFDCATRTISPATIDYFGSWIDAVTAQGARPILSLSYVPPCFARDGQPKGPPNPGDVGAYRTFLDDLLRALVTDRAAAGKEPLRWLELWNEPDIPIDPGNPNAGHGYVGTLDEYLSLNLPSLSAAILEAQSDSGVTIHVGTPAAFSPWTFGSVYGDLATMLERANGFDRPTAEALAARADSVLGPGGAARVMGNGGFTWPRATIDAAAKLGLTIDFASVHLYPNNPLQGVSFPESSEPDLVAGRNPDASPEDFATLASRWSAEFPDQELVVSEWALSAGTDDRFGTCETASFDAASLSVMQDSAIDRALYLGNPRRAERAPFRAWRSLPPSQVEVTGPTPADHLWSTAATGGGRTTLLLSQWHSRLVDAGEVDVPVTFTGLADGDYQVTVEVIGQGTSPGSSRTELAATVTGGRLDLPRPVRLRGQALARIDVRAAGVDPLPPLVAGGTSDRADSCLPTEREATTTTSTTTTTTTPTGGPPAGPVPVPGAPSFTG